MATDLGTALYAWVKTVPALTDLLGEGDDCQFYPVAILENKTPPHVVYEEEKDDLPATHTEAPSVGSGIVKFACVGLTTSDANNLAGALQDALLGFAGGLMGSVPVSRVQAKGSSPAYNWAEQQFAVDASFKFWYRLS